jgi:hypothetical protein
MTDKDYVTSVHVESLLPIPLISLGSQSRVIWAATPGFTPVHRFRLTNILLRIVCVTGLRARDAFEAAIPAVYDGCSVYSQA